MIDWGLLYTKFGKKKSAEKFEDLALEYVKRTYSQYTWTPTPRTRDGNRDFHNLENELLNIWGEAKYKKDSISLTKKDLDPTILSGLIDGKVKLIIFVTNGKIPESLITRMVLGASLKGIKLSFVMGDQLSDWLILNSNIYKVFFEEPLEKKDLHIEQLVEFKNVFFYEPISLDFKANLDKVYINVDDSFILNCMIVSTKECIGKINLETGAPFSFMDSELYEAPDKFEIHPGLNVFSFLTRANSEYNDSLRIVLTCNDKTYYYVSENIVIKRNNQLKIDCYEQINILNNIKMIIEKFDKTLGSYIFYIQGRSGMGKSYILNAISLDYCLKNDLTLVTFENGQGSNNNYLLLCRIIIFLKYGNVFWNFETTYVKQFCLKMNSLHNDMPPKLLESILDGAFDANMAKTTILSLLKLDIKSMPPFVHFNKIKTPRVLLLDDMHYLNVEQGSLLKILISQQLESENNNILIMAGRPNEFADPTLEELLLDNISNVYKLDKLTEKDKESTILQNFILKEKKVSKPFIDQLPSNLLLLNEVLFNLKYSFEFNSEINNFVLTNRYIKLFDNNLVFQQKFRKVKEQWYLLDIIYLFKKGIAIKKLYDFFHANAAALENDIYILKKNNCIVIRGDGIACPFHDYLSENYRNLRKGKEFNETTGEFLKNLIDMSSEDDENIDVNYMLSLLCKCGEKYFYYYSTAVRELMIKYIKRTEYGTAIFFAELFYNSISNKESLNQDEKYYLYLYADCLVHCDNKYRAKEILESISQHENFGQFEKYEALVSLLNQRFWSLDLEGIVKDSKMYQIDLENMFMHNLDHALLMRFKKSYEACFNRRMVTLLLLDEYKESQKAYREGIHAIKRLSVKYELDYKSEIATIIMDYARGNMVKNPKLACSLLNKSIDFFQEKKNEHIRRYLICKIDLFVCKNIIGETIDYINLNDLVTELSKYNFLSEYIKGLMKLSICKIIDYSKINNQSVSIPYLQDLMNKLDEKKIEHRIVLKNRDLYLYNYIAAYSYIMQEEYALAEACIKDNLEYIKEAGDTYKTPLLHNLKSLYTIQTIEWFQQNNTKYTDTVYLIDSRFW